MRFIHIGDVDGRHEPTHSFVTRMAAQRTMKADTPRFKQPGHGDVVHMHHDVQVLISGVNAHLKRIIFHFQAPAIRSRHWVCLPSFTDLAHKLLYPALTDSANNPIRTSQYENTITSEIKT